MATILDLSPELMSMVSSELRQVDLLNMSLTCKTINHAVIPDLYREYHDVNGGPIRKFRKLAKTLVERPELARHCRYIRWEQWVTLRDFNPKHHLASGLGFDEHLGMMKGPEPSQAEYEKLTSAAKAAGVIDTIFPYEERSYFLQRLQELVKKARKHEQASKRANRVEFRIGRSNRPSLVGQGDQIGPRGWEKHIFDPNLTIDEVPFDQQFCQLLRAGVDNAYAVLLLGLLPNIQDIVLQTSTIQMDQLPWKLPKHGFKNLRRLHVMAEERNGSWPVAFFEDILKAPKLEKLEVRGSSCWYRSPVGLEEDTWGPVAKWLTLPPKSTNIKIIQLDQCIIPLQQLNILLNACQGLKGFHYTIGSSEHPSLNFSPIELIDALGQHKDTLEELRFDISESVPVEECFWPEESRIKSIADFKSLKYFDIWREFWAKDSKNLKLRTRLPSSLVTLVLGDCATETPIELSQIRPLLTARRQGHCLPNLRTFHIYSEHVETREDEEEMEELAAQERELYEPAEGQSHGVSFLDFQEISSEEYAAARDAFLNDGMTERIQVTFWDAEKSRYRKCLQTPCEVEFDEMYDVYDPCKEPPTGFETDVGYESLPEDEDFEYGQEVPIDYSLGFDAFESESESGSESGSELGSEPDSSEPEQDQN